MAPLRDMNPAITRVAASRYADPPAIWLVATPRALGAPIPVGEHSQIVHPVAIHGAALIRLRRLRLKWAQWQSCQLTDLAKQKVSHRNVFEPHDDIAPEHFQQAVSLLATTCRGRGVYISAKENPT